MRDTSLAPGSLAPELELSALHDSQVHHLSDFRGKFVVLNFLASWCFPCSQEMPALERLHKKISSLGGTVVAVGVDDNLKGLQEFQKKHEVSFPFLVDSKGLSTKKYRLSGFPETFILTKDGRLSLLIDPETGQPVLKFVGPRDWDSPQMIDLIQRAVASHE
ncbi:MAG: TlpA family protein disulfide reductase [Bdellovibrionales bacterium]|nr:TlpA family protein disulfide reductase [Bdellovibrionales bacterium]